MVGNGETLTATTCNAGGNFNDTKLQVWCYNCEAPICVNGDDDDPDCSISTVRSTVTWLLGIGKRPYLIAIGGYSTNAGVIELSVTADGAACIDPPVCEPPTGACCSNGMCTVENELDCAAIGGTYVGDGSSCDPNPCAAGACCFGDGTCSVLTESDCINSNGLPQGGGTTCDPNPCPQVGDDCGDAIEITASPYSTTFDTSLYQAGAPSCNTSYPVTQNDIWHSYTPTEDCLMVLDVVDTGSYDMVIGHLLRPGLRQPDRAGVP